MSIEILTKEDLNRFKIELIAEFERILETKQQIKKKWLRSKEVEKMLNISPATLQNYRISGAIKFSKVGSTYYYDLDAINKILDKNAILNIA